MAAAPDLILAGGRRALEIAQGGPKVLDEPLKAVEFDPPTSPSALELELDTETVASEAWHRYGFAARAG